MERNILFVIQNDLLGGAEQLLKSLANEYVSRGNKVQVVIMRAPMERNWDDLPQEVNIKYLDASSYFRGIFKLARFLIAFTKRNKFDYIFASNININGVLGFLKKMNLLKANKLIIRETTSVFLRTTGLKKMVHTFKYVVGYSGADLIICQTELMQQQFLDNLNRSKKWKMISLQNPINLTKILSLAHSEKADLMSEDRNYIVSAGRFISEKGFDTLIKAFAPLAEKFSNLDLMILGEGNLRPSYEQLIQDLNLETRIFLPGFKKNPIPYFKQASVCVVSSRFEGFPNVLLQMGAVNSNLVATKCAGNLDKIPNILLLEPNDSEELAKTLELALATTYSEEQIELKNNYLNSIQIPDYLNHIEYQLVNA